MKIKTALISVADKMGLGELATALAAAGVQVYSTGGSAAFLRNVGIKVSDVVDLTGFPEILDGRVKTLHPHIHASILADAEKESHRETLKAYGLPSMDLVVVNFYPFEKTAAQGLSERDMIEHIDIGGPCLVRAAAKNFHSTIVLTDPADYPIFIGEMRKNKGDISVERSRVWAAKAFVTVAHLDGVIANYFSAGHRQRFPEHHFLHVQKQIDLSYGENPHQHAACYQYIGSSRGYGQLQGPQLSYNNMLDAQFSSNAAALFDEPTAVIVKHNNPCGVAVADNLCKALVRARRCDAISAFGGIVAFNRAVEEDLAEALSGMFLEVVIAPQFSPEAKRILADKERLRLLLTPGDDIPPFMMEVRSMHNLFLVQTPDAVSITAPKTVTQTAPTQQQMRDLLFAWKVAACIKSNAVVLANNNATIGIGAGQMSRIDSARLACQKAGYAKIKTAGAVAASDGFFPFPDSVEELAKAGIQAIIQPGGGKNDDKITEAANALGIAMVYTGRRHFRH